MSSYPIVLKDEFCMITFSCLPTLTTFDLALAPRPMKAGRGWFINIRIAVQPSSHSGLGASHGGRSTSCAQGSFLRCIGASVAHGPVRAPGLDHATPLLYRDPSPNVDARRPSGSLHLWDASSLDQTYPATHQPGRRPLIRSTQRPFIGSSTCARMVS